MGKEDDKKNSAFNRYRFLVSFQDNNIIMFLYT